jgi:hypothetical protein
MIVVIKRNFRIFTQSSCSIVLSLSVYESEMNMIMLSLLVSPLRKKTVLTLALSRKSRGRQAGVAIILALYFLLFLNRAYTYSV